MSEPRWAVRRWAWVMIGLGLGFFLVFSVFRSIIPIAVAGWVIFVVGLVTLMVLNWRRLRRGS